MEPPKCRLCETSHYFRDGCNFGKSTAKEPRAKLGEAMARIERSTDTRAVGRPPAKAPADKGTGETPAGGTAKPRRAKKRKAAKKKKAAK